MSELEAVKLLKSLLQQNPEQVQSWLKNIWAEQKPVPEKFNWLSLAELSASKAREMAFNENEYSSSSIDWADVSTSVYEFLAHKHPEFSPGYLSCSMNLRAEMIVKFGAVSNNSVLDAQIIINWFFDNLEISYEDALIKTKNWRDTLASNDVAKIKNKFETDMEDMKKISFIKNRLNTIKVLSQSKDFHLSEELNNWISFGETLT
jgi:hypothetical protein